MKKKKKNTKNLVPKPKEIKKTKAKTIGLVLLSLGIVLLLFILLFKSPEKNNESNESKIGEFQLKKPLFNSTRATAYLAAVDSRGNGVITLLVVEAVPGSGRTLVDIDNLLFWADTQHSIRIAKRVAENITGINVSNYDIVYNIYANASVIGGESAGAAITLATIAALQNRSLRDDVIITGTINHDGTIGLVQAVLPKAKAARQHGAKLFLVPLLQSREVNYEVRRHCDKFGAFEYCREETVPRLVNISEEAGIEVKEVRTIQEAMQYFFNP